MPAPKKKIMGKGESIVGGVARGGASRGGAARKAIVKIKLKPNTKAEPRSNVKVKPAAKTKGNPPDRAKVSEKKTSSVVRSYMNPTEKGDNFSTIGKRRLERVDMAVAKKNKKK